MSPPPPEPPDFPASQLFLRRLAFSLVRDEARAEDLVQDTWTAWIEHRPSGVAEPRAWLARVLRNRAFNLKRSERRRAEREELAGRPDPSAPEVEGTLEAQAQLIEALRKLEEPYRSTLVERYYHDLSPAEIAGRSGTPLNTVKARLLRGLNRLREEMDRRYGGDRRAWCHWLVSLGAPPLVPVTGAPGGTPPLPAPPTWDAPATAKALKGLGSAGAPASLLSWILLSGAIVSGLAWVLWRSTRTSERDSPVTFVEKAAPARDELLAPARERVSSEPVRSVPVVTIPLLPDAPERPAPIVPPLPFEWTQLAGAPTHDGFSAFQHRADLIQRPRVLWTRTGLSGQPTIAGTELYSGGDRLYHVDLATLEVSVGSPEVIQRIQAARGTLESDESEWNLRLARHGLTGSSWVAGAPAITRDSVLARMVGDGSVSAFDRDLVRELWRWEPSAPAPCPLSGCLVGERFLVAHGREVVSLSVVNGAVDWRFDTGDAGRVDMVPACDGDLVYFATDGGVVFALDLARGEEEWRTKTPRRYGGAYPVVLGERVLFADEGTTGPPWLRRAELRAFQTYDGRELWHSALDPYSNVGVGNGIAAIVGPENTVLFSVEGGTARSYLSDTLGYGGRKWNGAAPVFVGSEVLVALNENGGHVSMRDLRTGMTRWTCELGRQTTVLDVVHAGDRIYVATTRGLVCLADDPGKEPPPPGFVLGPGAEEDEGERASPKSLEDRRRKR